MILTFEVFKTAVRALQNNTLQEIFNSLESVRGHHEVLQQNYIDKTDRLSRTIIYYKKYENQMNWRKESINTNEIQVWVPLFQKHKEADVFPDVKADTIQKIVSAKREMDHIDLSLSELKLRLVELARSAKSLQDDIRKAATQLFVLESAVDISVFLSSSKYDPKEIAEYEFQKYYDLYRRAGNEIG